MIKAIIIEDEISAQEILFNTLKEISLDIEIVAVLGSVKESVNYLKGFPRIDLIFCDVQMADGLSFEIFEKTQVNIPVIFITGYDNYMLTAFESNGIDYLIKPVSVEDMTKALLKYKMLENHFVYQMNALQNLFRSLEGKRKTRMIVKRGIENISVRLEDVVMFYTENKMVYAIDNCNKKFIVDKTLNEIDEELTCDMFFRANRQYIINLNFVKSYKPYEKVKLQVDLNHSEKDHFIIISQITAPHFRKWISEF